MPLLCLQAVFKLQYTSVCHSLVSPGDTCLRHYSPGTVPVTGVDVCCDVAASVLMGISGSKDLSCLIVPQCLRPRACNCEAIRYYSDFISLTCGFPSENRSFGLQLLSYLQSSSRNWLCHNLSFSLSPCVFYLFVLFNRFFCTKSPKKFSRL